MTEKCKNYRLTAVTFNHTYMDGQMQHQSNIYVQQNSTTNLRN